MKDLLHILRERNHRVYVVILTTHHDEPVVERRWFPTGVRADIACDQTCLRERVRASQYARGQSGVDDLGTGRSARRRTREMTPGIDC